MTVEVNARHKNISEGFRDYAQTRAKKIGEAFPMVESVRVVMDFQNNFCAAEVIAQRKDETFVGSALTTAAIGITEISVFIRFVENIDKVMTV